MIHHHLPSRMEDLFFLKEEKRLIEQLKKMEKMKETKEALAQVSGIRDEALLQKFVDLNIRPETVASVSLIPLIEVAWADGGVDEKEREALLSAVHQFGIKPGDIDYELVKEWTAIRPSAQLLEAWMHYIEHLCERLMPVERAALKKEILEQTTAIAEASGGLLGLGDKISKSERAMLQKLESAFPKA
ncbi:MAG: TerB family tellurite resistance protein [Spirochaetes bacterium]|nr:TerB family tellurite resistance protein [Spirochaetota bacterium]